VGEGAKRVTTGRDSEFMAGRDPWRLESGAAM
jgi:hypothetical protein